MLKQLSIYNPITIQCHNNPDADALASGFALYTYFNKKGIDTRLIYCGNPITKPNLKLMVDKLGIPIRHVETVEDKLDGLLLLVDCQYGERNVTKLSADTIAVIDHHSSKGDSKEVDYLEIDPQLGSCSTLVWKMLKEEGFLENRNCMLETALYYGLMTDTENFIEAHNPFDLDMRDDLEIDKMVISQFCNSNITLSELEVAGIALLKNIYNGTYRYSVAQAKPCDPNVMGVIIDLVKTVDAIDSCVIFNDCGGGYKLSVRSCVGEIRANELAEYIVEGIGSAGGHNDKAGGFCDKELFAKLDNSLEFESYVNMRMAQYFDSVKIIRASEYEADINDFNLYSKKDIPLGYVDPMEFLKEDTKVLIRTLEGDVNSFVDGSFYIMIGILGEVYPIKKEAFEVKYRTVDEEYECSFDYSPTLRTKEDGSRWDLTQYAKTCRLVDRGSVYVKQLDNYAKVYTEWDKDNYMYGKPGDYLAVRVDNHHDIYIIRQDIFEKTYELAK